MLNETDTSEMEELVELNGYVMIFLFSYGRFLSPLALCFLFYLPSYYRAFKRNRHAYSESPFRPLIMFAYRTIMYFHPALYVAVIIAVVIRLTTSVFLSFILIPLLVCPFVIFLNWFTASYQLIISVISIHRLINSRRSSQFRKQLSHRQVQILTYGIFGLIALKDLETGRRLAAVYTVEKLFAIETPGMYYTITCIVHQVLVFIAMACQFCVKEPASSHAENVIATHIKYIGAIKLPLDILYALSIFMEYMEFTATALIIGIDFFLVPLIIQMTEIKKSAPNVISPVTISIPVIDVQKIEISLN